MKKSLLAVAAMTAFVGAAQAQSSVSVYGILDVGYSATSSTTAAGVATKVAEVNSGSLSTSRLGFRGTEDIGGGLKAGFVAEIGVNPTSPNFSGSSNNYYATTGLTTAGSTIDNRQTFVSLEKAGVGTLKVGRQYTMVHEAIGSNTAGGANNVIGDGMYSGGNTSSAASLISRRDDNYTIRATQAINLVSPTLFGATVTGQYSTSAKDVDITTGAAGQGANYTNTAGARLNYVFGKFTVDLAGQNTRVKRDTIGTATNAQFMIGNTVINLTPTAGVAAINTNTVDTAILASYDFGMLKAFYGHTTRQTIDSTNIGVPIQTVKKNVDQIGVKAPVTAAIDLTASYSKGKFQNLAAAQNFGINAYQLMADYKLSKRTNLYAIYGAAGQDTTTGVGNGAAKDSQAAVGMRHSF